MSQYDGKGFDTAAMHLVVRRRQLAPAAAIVVLAALAGCASSGAAAGSASTVAASAAASISARPPTAAKSSAAVSTSARQSSGTSTASAPAPTTAAPTPRGEQTASALLDSALSAMQAQQSFHMACTTSASAAGDSTDAFDIGVASGRAASSDPGFTITAMLVDGIAYLSTDNAGVWESEGIPQAEADKLAAGEWLSIGPGQSYGNKMLFYAKLIAGLTVADQVDSLRLPGTLKRTGATTAQGVPVYGVSGQAPSSTGLDGTVTVYIAATGAPLPVRETIHAIDFNRTCDYSGWDKPLNLTAPSNVLPVTAIPK